MSLAETRIQLCGRLVARVEGRRIEGELPGGQGRALFAYLVVHRLRSVGRDELINAIWAGGQDGGLSPLLSKLRRLVTVEGRGEARLVLPADVWIDLEAAVEALHRAESAFAGGRMYDAYGPARVTQHIAARPFACPPGPAWVADVQRRLDGMFLRALELVAASSLEIGGAELDTAERAARKLVATEPFRESGHRLLMQILAANGNRAEALRVYDDLRLFLRDELGVAPSKETQAAHQRLLA